MQVTDAFTAIITAHLDDVAKTDLLFAETLKKPKKNIKDCITYIMNTVKSSGKNGFADGEIFGMAIHYYDEDNISVGKPVNGKVVVNHLETPSVPALELSSSMQHSHTQKKQVKKQSNPVNQASLF